MQTCLQFGSQAGREEHKVINKVLLDVEMNLRRQDLDFSVLLLADFHLKLSVEHHWEICQRLSLIIQLNWRKLQVAIHSVIVERLVLSAQRKSQIAHMWGGRDRVVDECDPQRQCEIERVGDDSCDVVFGLIAEQKDLSVEFVYDFHVQIRIATLDRFLL